jgi:hypothetical protein
MACEFADDAYLIAAFPQVVVRTAERWLVVVVAAQAGAYDVTLGGASFPYAWVAGDATTDVRDGLQSALGGQPLAAVGLLGVNGLVLDEVAPGGLTVTATGPEEGDIAATLQPGTGDSNAASRAFWLARAKCGLPPCCRVTCAADFTLMHAALAAHLILTGAGTGGTGQFATSSRCPSCRQASRWGPRRGSRPRTACWPRPSPGACF